MKLSSSDLERAENEDYREEEADMDEFLRQHHANEFKGTPGPWIAREIEGAFHKQKAYAIDFNEDQEQVVDYVYRKEDADLIAASPKLFKAVNDFLNHFEGNIPLWLFEEAENAVADALGK